jgi:hypothetical protein
MGEPLQVTTQDMRANHYTVVIYWRKRTGNDALQNGHAAMIIDTAAHDVTDPGYYVSWLSDGGKSKGLGTIFKATQAYYMRDSAEWGGTLIHTDHAYGIDFHAPTRWVVLKHLNVGNMKAAWDQMRNKESAHWKLIDKNCATAVARILKAGGGDDYATGHKKQLVWWPTDLLKYAKSMDGKVVRTSN